MALAGVVGALVLVGVVFGALKLVKGSPEETEAAPEEVVEVEEEEPEERSNRRDTDRDDRERRGRDQNDDRDADERSDRNTVNIPEAYPGAGGPIPSDAMPFATIHEEQYGGPIGIFMLPSENIGCDFSDDYQGCGVLSYIEDQTYGIEPGIESSRWWINFTGGGVPEIHAKGDVAYFMRTDIPVQILEYGQVLYWGEWVCASQESGLTCWNSDTGHGAHMNRAGTTTF